MPCLERAIQFTVKLIVKFGGQKNVSLILLSKLASKRVLLYSIQLLTMVVCLPHFGLAAEFVVESVVSFDVQPGAPLLKVVVNSVVDFWRPNV